MWKQLALKFNFLQDCFAIEDNSVLESVGTLTAVSANPNQKIEIIELSINNDLRSRGIVSQFQAGKWYRRVTADTVKGKDYPTFL